MTTYRDGLLPYPALESCWTFPFYSWLKVDASSTAGEQAEHGSLDPDYLGLLP